MGTGVDLVSDRYLVCQVVRLPDGGQHCQVGGGHLGSNHDDDIILSGRNITSILLLALPSQHHLLLLRGHVLGVVNGHNEDMVSCGHNVTSFNGCSTRPILLNVVAPPGDNLDKVKEVLPVRIRHQTDTDHMRWFSCKKWIGGKSPRHSYSPCWLYLLQITVYITHTFSNTLVGSNLKHH